MQTLEQLLDSLLPVGPPLMTGTTIEDTFTGRKAVIERDCAFRPHMMIVRTPNGTEAWAKDIMKPLYR